MTTKSTTPKDAAHGRYTLAVRVLEAKTAEEASRRLRAVLKFLLRTHGIKCEKIEPAAGNPLIMQPDQE